MEGEEIREPAPIEKKVRVNVILPEKLLKSISKLTTNRSDFLSKAAKYTIDNKIAL
ncbi:hypothetical protein H7R39_10055 [Campylobacter sp. Marseille-Q3452]|uniref:Uncharacterized protein n=1 Tax=Campylobacter massiliensis TaxID=2762557 RepID=A0A842J806_9BACT|nr:hypothetical protein [Campylobacter massiliensis]MBC2883588.1 hypothetical protein [Campylobacter massiliensis]